MAIFGANLEALQELKNSLDRTSQRLRRLTTDISADVSGMPQFWHGPDAQEFTSLWSDTHRPRMLQAADDVSEATETIARNLEEQRVASSVDLPGGGGIGGGNPGDRN